MSCAYNRRMWLAPPARAQLSRVGACRKGVLKQYRRLVVRPKLAERCVFGTPGMPLQLESCSLCGTPSIEVPHMVTCTGRPEFFNSFRCDMFFWLKHHDDPVLQDHS